MKIDLVWLEEEFLRWVQLPSYEPMKDGDVLIFVKMNEDEEIDENWECPNPASIESYSWSDESGRIMSQHQEGRTVSWIGEQEFHVEKTGYGYAVFRKVGGPREYKPSAWAEPLPLP